MGADAAVCFLVNVHAAAAQPLENIHERSTAILVAVDVRPSSPR
jgi:hypothetical protein